MVTVDLMYVGYGLLYLTSDMMLEDSLDSNHGGREEARDWQCGVDDG